MSQWPLYLLWVPWDTWDASHVIYYYGVCLCAYPPEELFSKKKPTTHNLIKSPTQQCYYNAGTLDNTYQQQLSQLSNIIM